MTKYIINNKPRAWVGCLGCYNNGSLNGLWVDGVDAADTDSAGLSEAGECLKCGSDEFWVFDYEGYGDILGGECAPLEAANVAAAIAKIEDGGHNIERVMTYAANFGLSLENYDEWCDQYEDAIMPYDNAIEYAQSLIDTGILCELPEHLAAYIDADKLPYDNAIEYAQSLIDSGILCELPEHLAAYIDADKLAHDLQIGGDIWESNGYLFHR